VIVLSEERKIAIRTEELYRKTVRREINGQKPPASHPTRLWNFLNSTLGIWFLSTCVLGVASFSFTAFYEMHKANLENTITINRLDAEISARLHSVILGKTKKVTAEMLLSLEEPGRTEFPSSIFPEYKSRTFRSLLYELHLLIPIEEKQEVKLAIASTEDWHKRYLAAKALGDGGSGFSNWINKVSGVLILKPLNLKRWGMPFGDDLLKKRASSDPVE
jgi:hypothetical protein